MEHLIEKEGKLITDYKEGAKEWEIGVMFRGPKETRGKKDEDVRAYKAWTSEPTLKDCSDVHVYPEDELIIGKLAISTYEGKVHVEIYNGQSDRKWYGRVSQKFQIYSFIDDEEMERRLAAQKTEK